MNCQYKDSLGKPGEGLHSTRFGGFAAIDLLLTALLAAAISYFATVGFLATFVCLLVLATILHLVFCVQTHFTHDVLGIN